MAEEEGDEGAQAHSVAGSVVTVVGCKNGELDVVRARRGGGRRAREGGTVAGRELPRFSTTSSVALRCVGYG